MKKDIIEDVIGSIIYNEINDIITSYYVVKNFDGQILRIEQIKKLPDDIKDKPKNLDEYRKKKIGICYYNKYEKGKGRIKTK